MRTRSENRRSQKMKRSTSRVITLKKQRKSRRSGNSTLPTPIVNRSSMPSKVLISGIGVFLSSGAELFVGKENLESFAIGVTLFMAGVVITQMGWGWRIFDGVIGHISETSQSTNHAETQVSETLGPILSLLLIPRIAQDG